MPSPIGAPPPRLPSTPRRAQQFVSLRFVCVILAPLMVACGPRAGDPSLGLPPGGLDIHMHCQLPTQTCAGVACCDLSGWTALTGGPDQLLWGTDAELGAACLGPTMASWTHLLTGSMEEELRFTGTCAGDVTISGLDLKTAKVKRCMEVLPERAYERFVGGNARTLLGL